MRKNNFISQEKLYAYKSYIDNQTGKKYPCSNQNVVCGIVTRDKNKAIRFMKNKNVAYKFISKNEIIWFLHNGEKWIWRQWNINIRGIRFYKIAMDMCVDIDLFHDFIIPCCSLYCCHVDII